VISTKTATAVILVAMFVAVSTQAATGPETIAPADATATSKQLQVVASTELVLGKGNEIVQTAMTYSSAESGGDDAIYLLAGAFLGMAYLSRVARRGRKLRSVGTEPRS
jgi:hypothetical protein